MSETKITVVLDPHLTTRGYDDEIESSLHDQIKAAINNEIYSFVRPHIQKLVHEKKNEIQAKVKAAVDVSLSTGKIKAMVDKRVQEIAEKIASNLIGHVTKKESK